MPTYVYQCTACEEELEIFQRITENPLTTCEKCGGTLKRKIFPAGILFKGPGFHVNDYASSYPKSNGHKASDSTEE